MSHELTGEKNGTAFIRWMFAQRCDVYSKLKQGMNNSMEGVGCPSQTLHNAAQTASDILLLTSQSVSWNGSLTSAFIWFKLGKLKDPGDFVGI